MIDLHHHCLPGIDDGPRTWEESVDQCRMALDEGIDRIIATPHVLRGHWANESPQHLDTLVAELNQRLGGRPRIVRGSEYFFAHDMVDLLEQKRSIVPLAGSRYVLVEFAANAIPPLIDSVFYRLQVGGWVPVIAHPERNLVFQNKPELLVGLLRQGGKTQVTAMSITGEFGAKARKSAFEWIGQGMVHFIATDAHNISKRPPRVREASSIIRKEFGERMADALLESNPEAVAADQPLPWDPEPKEHFDHGFLKRIFGFSRRK